MLKFRTLLYGFIVVIVALLAGVAAGSWSKSEQLTVFPLQVPSFVKVASAEETPQDVLNGSQYVVQFAGISAYTQAGTAIDLDAVRSVFTGIEYETSEYLIGTVEIADYSANHYPHVYVNTNGWVVAYYLEDEVAAFIVDIEHFNNDGIGTKLELGLGQILNLVGVSNYTVNYYDFRYPNATSLAFGLDNVINGTDTFDVLLPSAASYSERSWYHSADSTSSRLYLNGVEINRVTATSLDRGILSQTNLPPNTIHTFQVGDWGNQFAVVGFVYQE